MVDPRSPDGVARHLLDVHVGTRRIRKHRDDPGGIVDGKDLADGVVVKVTVELLDQGGAVVEQELARAVGKEVHLIAVTRPHLILQGVPFLAACAVGAATDVLLTAPMTQERTLGILLLVLMARTECQQDHGYQNQTDDAMSFIHD